MKNILLLLVLFITSFTFSQGEKAIKIADVQDLGDVMINQLTDLFSEDKKRTVH